MLNCYVVKDLLPNYVEGLLGAETARDVDEHLGNCEICQTLCNQMNVSMEPPNAPLDTSGEEVNFLKKMKIKTSRMKITAWISWALTFTLAVMIAFFITNFIIVNAKVQSASMENTIMTNNRVIAYRLAYLYGKPERFDVVVFPFPDDEKVLYVKRIIGLSGETVEIRGGNVFINGDQIQDSEFIKELPTGNFGPYVVPEGYYFMLGDNRNDSLDSRYWNNNFVDEDKILGKAIFKYYPQFKIIK